MLVRGALACLSLLALSQPALAQEDIGFKPVPSVGIVVTDLSDATVNDLLATLDSLLARQREPSGSTTHASTSGG